MPSLTHNPEQALELLPPNFSIEGWRNISVTGHGLIEAVVPTSCIVNFEPPLDRQNLSDLKDRHNSMQQKGRGFEGQLMPILTGIVTDRDNEHEIIDGFHRHELKRTTTGLILARVMPSITWSDLLEQRIGAAVPHTSLQYARVVRWSQQFWDLTEWADELSIINAFALSVDAKKAERFDIDATTIEAISKWVASKAHSWNLEPEEVLNYLRSAEGLPDEIVERIRQGKGANFTLEKAKVLAEVFPGEVDIQVVLAEEIQSNGYTLTQTRLLADVAGNARNPEEASGIAKNSVHTLKSSTSKKANGGSRKHTNGQLVGLPRMRTPNELCDEISARIHEVSAGVTLTPERVNAITVVIGALQGVLDAHAERIINNADDTDPLDSEQIIPTFRTEEDRKKNYAMLIDYFFSGVVAECPSITESWQLRMLKREIQKRHSDTQDEALTARLALANGQIIALNDRMFAARR